LSRNGHEIDEISRRPLKSDPDEKFPRRRRGNMVVCFELMTAELIELLRQRIAIIADHTWRDRDGEGHLQALKEVSEKITAWTAAHRSEVDPQLRHYLGNSSFQKALAHLEAGSGE
jgi:hypothetical protein